MKALIALFLLLIPSICLGRVLEYTIPSYYAAQMFDEETGLYEPICDINFSKPLRDIKETYIYRYTPGGMWVRYRSKIVIGREGQPDTLQVQDNDNIYVTTTNSYDQEACASSISYGLNTTGVEVVTKPSVVSEYIIDVRGRTIKGKLPRHGFYWKVQLLSNGKRKVVQLR